MPGFGLTDVHELPMSPFDLDSSERSETDYETTKKPQILETFLRATTFAIQANSLAISLRNFGHTESSSPTHGTHQNIA
jgi:hypothetical protein